MHTKAPRPTDQDFAKVEPETRSVTPDGIVWLTQRRTVLDQPYIATIVYEDAFSDNRVVRGAYDGKTAQRQAEDAIKLVRERRRVREDEGEVAYRTREDLWQ